MSTAQSWHRLGDEFRRVGAGLAPEESVVAEYNPTGWVMYGAELEQGVTVGGIPVPWRLIGGTRAQNRFRALAQVAARTLGHSDGPHTWWQWLEDLRQDVQAIESAGIKEGPTVWTTGNSTPPTRPESGTQESLEREVTPTRTLVIPDVCEMSALFCERLAVETPDGIARDLRRALATQASAEDRVLDRGVPARRRIEWNDVEISFTSDHQCQIRIGAHDLVQNYDDLGLADRRSGKRGKPRAAWECLRGFAEKDGKVDLGHLRPYPSLPGRSRRPSESDDETDFNKLKRSPALPPERAKKARSSLEKKLQVIRHALRELLRREGFEASGDPFECITGQSYRARFRINCRASYRE